MLTIRRLKEVILKIIFDEGINKSTYSNVHTQKKKLWLTLIKIIIMIKLMIISDSPLFR